MPSPGWWSLSYTEASIGGFSKQVYSSFSCTIHNLIFYSDHLKCLSSKRMLPCARTNTKSSPIRKGGKRRVPILNPDEEVAWQTSSWLLKTSSMEPMALQMFGASAPRSPIQCNEWSGLGDYGDFSPKHRYQKFPTPAIKFVTAGALQRSGCRKQERIHNISRTESIHYAKRARGGTKSTIIIFPYPLVPFEEMAHWRSTRFEDQASIGVPPQEESIRPMG